MKRRIYAAAALLLALCITLTGCSALDFSGYFRNLSAMLRGTYTGTGVWENMAYTRPDMDEIRSILDESCRLAEQSEDLDAVLEGILNYYDAYDRFYTNLNLADIHYCADLTDTGWQEEYAYCTGQSSVLDAGLETLYTSLAASPIRSELESEDYFGAGFFDAYEGDSLWDETYTSLYNRESDLISRYYDLSGQALEAEYGSEAYYTRYAPQMAQLYVELIQVRQEQAAYLGYDSYPDYAYDWIYGRDYTAAQSAALCKSIQTSLTPLYRQINNSGIWQSSDFSGYSESDAFRYVRSAAADMGGVVADCFQAMEQGHLYDISFGENKYDSSFEVYLTWYSAPYVFTNPNGTAYDPLTFAHEFGHFCSDYVCLGSSASIDVSEIFSQGMEYLSLCYGESDQTVEKLKLLDCLDTYVEQAAYAEFERRAYDLTGEDLTVENLQALYAQVSGEFGTDVWNLSDLDFVSVTHFYTNPLYIISYVVSNDAAFQLYQLELETAGAGLTVYTDCLSWDDSDFLTFLSDAGLSSPFAAGRTESVREVLSSHLL